MLAAPPEILCMYFPRKELYDTADAASRALREVAVAYMERGTFDPRLCAFECHGHFHLGRPRRDRRASA